MFRTNRLEVVLEAVVGNTILNTGVEHRMVIERLHSSMVAARAVRAVKQAADRAFPNKGTEHRLATVRAMLDRVANNQAPAIAPVAEQEEGAIDSVVEVHHLAPAIALAAGLGIEAHHLALPREAVVVAEEEALVGDPAV